MTIYREREAGKRGSSRETCHERHRYEGKGEWRKLKPGGENGGREFCICVALKE